MKITVNELKKMIKEEIAEAGLRGKRAKLNRIGESLRSYIETVVTVNGQNQDEPVLTLDELALLVKTVAEKEAEKIRAGEGKYSIVGDYDTYEKHLAKGPGRP